METKANTTEMTNDELVFVDLGKKWEVGEPCLYPTIKNGDKLKERIGKIVYNRDERFGAMYSGHDLEGNELYNPTFELRQIKEQFIRDKEKLLSKMRAIDEERELDPVYSKKTPNILTTSKAESIPSPYHKELKGKSRLKKLNSVAKDKKEKSKSRGR